MNTTNTEIIIKTKCQLHLKIGRHGQKRIVEGPAPEPMENNGTVPRISRLMALAIHFEEQLQQGKVQDYRELAQLIHVSPPRMTQIMSLVHLAPKIQEDILFLPKTTAGRDPVTERVLRPIVAEDDWQEQMRLWEDILRKELSIERL